MGYVSASLIVVSIAALAVSTSSCGSRRSLKVDCKLVVKNSKAVIEKYDKDKNGRLDRRELLAMADDLNKMATRTNKKYGAEGGEDNIQQLEQRDVNGDGYVDLNEFAIFYDNQSGKWKSCI